MSASPFNLDRLHLPPRPANAREELEKVLSALVEDYGAEKIIAFGSCVRGNVTEHSDVDLCVIRQHPPGCTHPALEAEKVVSRALARLSTNLLVRSPDQINQARFAPFGVMADVLQYGVTLYER